MPRSQRPAPITSLEPSLPYLIHRIGARIEVAVNAAARANGLRIEGIRVLLRLAAREGQSIGELVLATSIEQSALSHMIKRMENDGLLARTKDPGDARTVRISLTARGRGMARKFEPYFLAISEASHRGMSRAEETALRRGLERVYENVGRLDALDFSAGG